MAHCWCQLLSSAQQKLTKKLKENPLWLSQSPFPDAEGPLAGGLAVDLGTHCQTLALFSLSPPGQRHWHDRTLG